MASALDQYRAAKSDYLKLRSQAKKELVARFHELAGDLLRIQAELFEDFGERVQLPSKPKRSTKVKRVDSLPTPPANAAKESKINGIRKRLDIQKRKLAELKANGKPAKPVEDRIYELEDELRLAEA